MLNYKLFSLLSVMSLIACAPSETDAQGIARRAAEREVRKEQYKPHPPVAQFSRTKLS